MLMCVVSSVSRMLLFVYACVRMCMYAKRDLSLFDDGVVLGLAVDSGLYAG